jgi:hypothetical protein
MQYRAGLLDGFLAKTGLDLSNLRQLSWGPALITTRGHRSSAYHNTSQRRIGRTRLTGVGARRWRAVSWCCGVSCLQEMRVAASGSEIIASSVMAPHHVSRARIAHGERPAPLLADLFFPVSTSGASLTDIEAAKRVCQRCPVTTPCLRWALDGRAQEIQDHHPERTQLTADQSAAVVAVLTDGKRVSVINAPAGSGQDAGDDRSRPGLGRGRPAGRRDRKPCHGHRTVQ